MESLMKTKGHLWEQFNPLHVFKCSILPLPTSQKKSKHIRGKNHPQLNAIYLYFPGGSDGKASVCNAGDPVRSLGREDPLEKEMATHSSTLAWKIP